MLILIFFFNFLMLALMIVSRAFGTLVFPLGLSFI